MSRPSFLSAITACCLVSLFGLCAGASAAKSEKAANAVDNFHLLDHNGVSHELHRQKHSKAIVLFVTGNGCPIARQSVPTLVDMAKVFEPKGVQFWMLNANPQDDRAAVRKEAEEFGMTLPILIDKGQWVAEALGVRRTGEAIVIDTKSWTIAYRGAVDDRLGYATQKAEPTHKYLADALDALVEGKPIATASSEFKGCSITFKSEADSSVPTYVKHVAPILEQHCVRCHSAGNIGPFAMSNYDKVKGWASMIREVLLEQRMPPSPADPEIGSFAGHAPLSETETRTLLRWIAGKTPRGEGEDVLASKVVPKPEPWPLGKPDVIVSMPQEFKVPATGVVPYQYFEVENPIQEDSWLRAAVVKPGNSKVLHHALIFVKYPEHLKSIEPRQNAGTAGFFTGFVPGAESVPFPEGTGKFLPKGTRIIFQMHYSPTGKPEADRTEIGLYRLPAKPQWELRTRAVTQSELLITPGQRDYHAKASYKFRKDAVLHHLSPHMHVRGASFKYDLVRPDGTSETLLSVPRWDFNWQSLYRLKQPLKIAAGSELVCSGTFDNSSSNPFNPNPKVWVIFGEQTTDEMFIGYYDIAVSPLEPTSTPKAPKKAAAAPAATPSKTANN